jgi:isoprenylcysteine carboxyl methyltransferase (ICMT) family protein YpbQ
MSIIILIVYLIGSHLRSIAFGISLTNELKLKSKNATEYGQKNSTIFATLHILFYIGCIIEAFIRKTQFDYFTLAGILIYAFSLSMLFYVIKKLDGLWTTKIILAEDHKLNTSFLFKYIKHPNYFLNLIPEFIGFALVCKSIYVFAIIFPLFLISLIIRIYIEEKVLRGRFVNYPR